MHRSLMKNKDFNQESSKIIIHNFKENKCIQSNIHYKYIPKAQMVGKPMLM